MIIPAYYKNLLCVFLFLFSTTYAFSQSHPNEEYRKFSLSITGGANFGDMNHGSYFMSSNFTDNIKDAPTFGAGVQYAVTPAWSLEAGYRRVTIEGISRPFETDLNMVTLKNIFNLNQILFINDISTRLNPFLTVGVGYDFFNYDGTDGKYSDSNTSYNAGAGIAYRLSHTLDLFAHYEYHLASNDIDNAKDGWGADLINTLSGGIRINFGKKNAIHPTWRTVPVRLERSEYNQFLTQAERIRELENQLAQANKREKDTEQQYLATIDSPKPNDNHVDHLSNQIAVSEHKSTDLQCIEVQEEPDLTEFLPAGHYVQIFATRHPMVANYIRGHAIQNLKKSVDDTDLEVMIFHRKYFYEVIIGRFDTVTNAREIKDIMTRVHNDAFVITFPRPINLIDTDTDDLAKK